MKNDRVFYTGNGGTVFPTSAVRQQMRFTFSLSSPRIFHLSAAPSAHVNVLFILDFPRTNVFTRSITTPPWGGGGMNGWVTDAAALPVSYLVA